MSRLNCCFTSPMTLVALLAAGGWRKERVQAADEALLVTRPLTEVNSFTAGIEGPACEGRLAAWGRLSRNVIWQSLQPSG